MKESDIQTKLKHFFEVNPPKKSGLYELKYVKSGNFGLASWVKNQPHQLRSLMAACTPGDMLYHKIADASYGQTPADFFIFAEGEALLIVYFEKNKKIAIVKAKKIYDLFTSGVKTCSFDVLSEMGTSYSL